MSVAQNPALLFALRPNRGDVKNIYGGQGHEYDYHKQGFSFGLLREDLRACSVRDITMTVDWDEGIPFVPSDLHVFGTVEKE